MASTDLVRDDIDALALERLRRIDQRYTGNCRALLDILAGAPQPVTIPEIVELSSGLATSSVYRNLATLERAGLITRIVTSHEHARFELADELSGHHHHLVCDACGKVSDITLPGALEAQLHKSIMRIAKQSGYRSVAHRVDLVGVCPDCD